MNQRKLKNILINISNDLIRFIIYFIIVFFFVCLIKDKMGETGQQFIRFYKEIKQNGLPGSFINIFIVSILFIFYVLIISAITVVQEQNYYKNEKIIKILLFLMNILPVALFIHVLFYRFGFRVIYYFLIYLIIKLFFENIIIDRIINIIKDKFKKIMSYLFEAVYIFIALLLINLLIPNEYKSFPDNQFNPKTIFEQITLFSYIVMFNAISFFTIDYCLNIFREEYKKYYTKYYFLYNNNILKRIIYVLRISLPQIIGKIKSSITWLIMFIISVEAIFENTENFKFIDSRGIKETIGHSLIIGYRNPNPSGLIKNIFFVMVAIFLLYILIDILKEIFTINNTDETFDENINTNNNILPKKSNRIFIISIASTAILFFLLYIYNYNNYAMAGYYEFSNDIEMKTLKYLIEDNTIKLENFSKSYLEENGELKQKYADIPLYKKNKFSYSILQLNIITSNGERRKLIPINDWATTEYSFIENNMYKGGVEKSNRGISASDKIEKIEMKNKFKLISTFNIMTSFRLPLDGNKEYFYKKPFGLILPFYLQFLMLIILITTIYTFLVYKIITILYFYNKDNKNKLILNRIGIVVKEIFIFINTLTLVIILILINICLQGIAKENIWKFANFNKIIIFYILIQIIINIMFTANYMDEIILNIKRLLSSNEFQYYCLIGINNNNLNYIYDKKYGYTLLLKHMFQNILFVFNINWFICYAFACWENFEDYIGITYAISIENIFTKILAFSREGIDLNLKNGLLNFILSPAIYNYLILFVINIILLKGYNYFQNKLIKVKR